MLMSNVSGCAHYSVLYFQSLCSLADQTSIMDTSPTALFDSYEQDFRHFVETIREKLEGSVSEDARSGKIWKCQFVLVASLTKSVER